MKLKKLIKLMNEYEPIALYNKYKKRIFTNYIVDLKKLPKKVKKEYLSKKIKRIYLDGECEEIEIILKK